MKERLIVGAALTGAAMLLAPNQDVLPEHALQQTLELEYNQHLFAEGRQLDLSLVDIAPKLPEAVKAVAGSAVLVVKGDGIGSGVKVAPDEFLTAGHMVVHGDDDGDTYSSNFDCTRLTMRARAPIVQVPSYDFMPAHDASGVKTSDIDLAVMWLTDEWSSADRGVPFAPVQDAGNKVGTEAFFVNYEPTSGNLLRSPSLDAADLAAPAEFGGVVIDDTDEKMLVLTGIGENYGSGLPDDRVRVGASGGPVFDENGGLEGITQAIYVADSTPENIASEFNVRLTGSLPGKHFDAYQVTIVQKVTPQILGGLVTAKSCE